MYAIIEDPQGRAGAQRKAVPVLTGCIAHCEFAVGRENLPHSHAVRVSTSSNLLGLSVSWTQVMSLDITRTRATNFYGFGKRRFPPPRGRTIGAGNGLYSRLS